MWVYIVYAPLSAGLHGAYVGLCGLCALKLYTCVLVSNYFVLMMMVDDELLFL